MAKRKPAEKKKPWPTSKELWDAAYPHIHEAGQAVMHGANDTKQVVQDGAAEVRNAIDNLAAKRITQADFKAIVQSWAQAAKSASERETAKAADSVLATMQGAVAAAFKLLLP